MHIKYTPTVSMQVITFQQLDMQSRAISELYIEDYMCKVITQDTTLSGNVAEDGLSPVVAH